MKKEKGITLVALIITIILLIILAAVTISAVYKSRVVEFATNGALGYLTEQEKELGYLNKTEEKLKEIEELTKKDLGSAEGKINFSTLIWNNGKASATIHKKENNEYKIEYKILDKEGNEVQGYKEIADGGTISNLELKDMVVARLFNETELGIKYSGTASLTVEDLGKPEVTVTKGNTTTKSITVKVTAIDNEAGMPTTPEYTYYIKKSTDTNYQENTKQTKLDANCTFDNLEQNKNYDVKVEVKDIAGNTGTGELKGITTTGIPDGAGDGTQEGAIAFENLSWSNQKASVTVRKTIAENYTIKYRVVDKNGTEIVSERDIASGETVSNLNLGDMVIARLTDGVNYGKTASITVTDLNAPTAPTFGTATGTVGTNGWYKTAVTVPIVAGTDAESGVLKTTYTITGAGAKGETEGTSVSISAQGTSVVTAYTYDKAGNKTSSVAKTIKIDTGNPNTATVSYVAHDTSSITVRTTAQDTVSGLAKVEYQYSTDGTSYTTKSTSTYTGTTEVTTNNGYKYTGLKDGTKYWLRIRVTDMAGRVTEGTAITQTTIKLGVSTDQLKIGDYVDYQPNTATNATYSTFQDGAERSGSSTQTILRDTSLRWRVMSVSGNKLTLVSETIPSGKLTLQGANGYNNGVKLLNDACNALYRNTALGATGRSVNVDDVNGLMGVTETTKKSINSKYGNEFTISTKNYPKIFQDEKYGSINGSYTGTLGGSQQISWYNESNYLIADLIKGIENYYVYSYSKFVSVNSIERCLCEGWEYYANQTTGSTTQFLSSRCVNYEYNEYLGGSAFCYRFHAMRFGEKVDVIMGSSYGNTLSNTGARIRPCVEIELTKANIGITGTGESGNPYSITER